jgi:hypothetical protein
MRSRLILDRWVFRRCGSIEVSLHGKKGKIGRTNVSFQPNIEVVFSELAQPLRASSDNSGCPAIYLPGHPRRCLTQTNHELQRGFPNILILFVYRHTIFVRIVDSGQLGGVGRVTRVQKSEAPAGGRQFVRQLTMVVPGNRRGRLTSRLPRGSSDVYSMSPSSSVNLS